MSQLSLSPWRLLFPYINTVPAELNELFYSALVALQNEQKADAIDWDNIYSWNIDQDLGTLTLSFDDESIALSAKMQILGSFDGSSFMWACHNPSIVEDLKRDSKRLREVAIRQGWKFFETDQFPATARDGYAIMAYAAQALQAPSAYAGQSGDQVVYFTLYDLVETQRETEDDLAQPEESPSFFDTFNSMIDAQVAEVQIGLPELRRVEAMCKQAQVEIEAKQYMAAVKTLDSAWEGLGDCPGDQEPASWICLAKANALFLAGDLPAASAALIEAEEAFACPDKVLLYIRMGQCAAGLEDIEKAKDYFVRVYVAAGSDGLMWLSPEHREWTNAELSKFREEARQRIAKVTVRGQPDAQFKQATAIVRCLIEDLYQFEKDANELGDEAAQEREEDHVLCEADRLADDQINSRWCRLLATWCTAGHSPKCGSRTDPPEHNPRKESIKSVYRDEDGLILVESESKGQWKQAWRYELCEDDGELRVSQIYSVIGDEEFPSL